MSFKIRPRFCPLCGKHCLSNMTWDIGACLDCNVAFRLQFKILKDAQLAELK
jgi:hypothetical protein